MILINIKTISILVITALISGFSGWNGSYYYQSLIKNNTDQSKSTNNNLSISNMRRNNPNGQNMIRGEIKEFNNNLITLIQDDGSSKLILIFEDSIINKTTVGDVADLKIGEKISVFGSTNSEGLITPVNIQIGSWQAPQMSK